MERLSRYYRSHIGRDTDMKQPCPCRHIREAGNLFNDGTGLCDPCKKKPVGGLTQKERKAKGLTTGVGPR